MATPATHESMFYEVMWRARAEGRPFPLPFWTQQYFRRWGDFFDEGLFDTKEASFTSNAFYRYWSMVGVKDHHQESLVGQAGEIEPVYDKYALSFFVFDSNTRQFHFPTAFQSAGPGASLTQSLDGGYLPIIDTVYQPTADLEVRQRVLATIVGSKERSVVVARFDVGAPASHAGAPAAGQWLCLMVAPTGPTGFERHDRAGRTTADRRLSFLRYVPADLRVEVNASWGPVFSSAPAQFGLYGNPYGNRDPSSYLDFGPFETLAATGQLNGAGETNDQIAGFCMGVFAWPLNFTAAAPRFTLDVKLPVDDYRGSDDLAELQNAPAAALASANRDYWTDKLDASGLQVRFPSGVAPLWDLYRTCRANLLILADGGEIHPGPTIYDSFWIRDSSIEAIACTAAGDGALAERQLAHHYPTVFTFDDIRHGPVSLCGFFGGEHEKNDFEWDSNGQALWAFGRYDRFAGRDRKFGERLFNPYVLLGSRWIGRNRGPFGLLHSGWSAEHIGDKDKPHYWDDLWAIAGLWEAARLAERMGAPQTSELWSIYDDVRNATADSIRWVIEEQRRRGFWETFIPTGPGDVGRLDSTIIGAAAYFHPCRLYMGAKLGPEVDRAARLTLETIWGRFVRGGFEHDAAWNTFGPYLTLQLAHAFLLVGNVDRMATLLAWCRGAAFAQVSNGSGNGKLWAATQGAWNEQHCYPLASDFGRFPDRAWYMGDIPHGWAAAEYMGLIRDICFFEADEDSDPHIFVAPGLLPGWLPDGEELVVADAPTIFGEPFGYRLRVNRAAGTLTLEITQAAPAQVRYLLPCRFGSQVLSVSTDVGTGTVNGATVELSADVRRAIVRFS
jgi:hypothetical protein